jgi:hypothetical protein
LFDDIEEVGFFTNRYVMPFENNLSIYLCRGLRNPIDEIWEEVRFYI